MQKRFVCSAAVLFAALVPISSPGQESSQAKAPHDAVVDAQTSREVPIERPEQKKTEHDLSDVFSPSKALPITGAVANQADHGQFLGFDLYKDPVGAMKPGMTFDDVYKALVAAKPTVMSTQRKLLESLQPRSQTRPHRQDDSRETARCRADGSASGRPGLGRDRPHERRRNP